MNKRTFAGLPLLLPLMAAAPVWDAASAGTPRPDDARAYIVSPAHGDTVDQTFVVTVEE